MVYDLLEKSIDKKLRWWWITFFGIYFNLFFSRILYFYVKVLVTICNKKNEFLIFNNVVF